MKLLKLIAVLLDYPQDDLWAHADELREACADPALSPARRVALRGFVDDLVAQEPMAAQERWLGLFDRGRAMSLLLFEHIHGESRDRGQAMVDLLATYRGHGFELGVKQLPDYLPVVLEYLSMRPVAEVRDWLGHIGHILELLAARAQERNSTGQNEESSFSGSSFCSCANIFVRLAHNWYSIVLLHNPSVNFINNLNAFSSAKSIPKKSTSSSLKKDISNIGFVFGFSFIISLYNIINNTVK